MASNSSNIFDDLDRTLYLLVKPNLDAAMAPENVEVSFAAPNSHFASGVSSQMISMFLYDVREDMELRTSQNLQFRTQPGAGDVQSSLKRPPVHVAYSYLITAWSPEGPHADCDEHFLLNQTLDVLLAFPNLPEEVLQGDLANKRPVPRVTMLTPNFLGSLGEFWNAMGGRPRPVIHYSVSVAREVADIQAKLITSTQYQVDQSNAANNPA